MRTLLIGSFLALLAVPAMAQGNNAINVFGTVEKLDATTISVKNDDGGQVQTFKLAPNVLYIQQRPARREHDEVCVSLLREMSFLAYETDHLGQSTNLVHEPVIARLASHPDPSLRERVDLVISLPPGGRYFRDKRAVSGLDGFVQFL